MNWRGVSAQCLVLLVACAGGWLFDLAGVPIGWVLGSLCGAAIVSNVTSLPSLSPNLRRFGQLVLGCATASILTPALLGQMVGLLPAMVLAAVIANAVGFAMVLPFARISGLDRLSATLCVLPAGLAEMAGLAQERGARADAVAMAHTARVTLVVLSLPLFVGADRQPLSPVDGSTVATAACLLISLVLAWLLSRFGLLNPWIVLPVIVGAIFVACGVQLAGLPPVCIVAAQVLIGASLGSRLPLGKFAEMPRILLAAIVSTAALFVGTAAVVGPLLYVYFDIDMTSIALALAPGGLAEVLAAAKAVGADVPLVLGFQLLRSLLTNTLSPLLVRKMVT